MSNDDPPLQKPTLPKFASYPKPEAEYQQIIQNPDIFYQKLQSFHDFCGTKFRVPTIGGNRLDLHRLFLEVTSRGGIDKVVKDRRWKEITGAFNFPSSITSASFVLRKYYLSLLYHFEQCYYFRKQQPQSSVADQTSNTPNGSSFAHAVNDNVPSNQFTVNTKLEDGSLITGTIDGKFDTGYLITVKMGSEDLKGVLYHAPMESSTIASPSFVTPPNALVRTRRRKHHSAFRDPGHPKRNRSGYTFFFEEQYHTLRPLYHGQERAISKRIGHLWNSLSESEKQVYQQKGLMDKERYKAEMEEYKSSHQQQAPS